MKKKKNIVPQIISNKNNTTLKTELDPALSWVELNIEGMKNLWGGKKSVLQRFN